MEWGGLEPGVIPCRGLLVDLSSLVRSTVVVGTCAVGRGNAFTVVVGACWVPSWSPGAAGHRVGVTWGRGTRPEDSDAHLLGPALSTIGPNVLSLHAIGGNAHGQGAALKGKRARSTS